MGTSITVDTGNELSGLWLIILEAGVALGLLVFIVWWTLPKKSQPTEKKDVSDD